MATTALPVAVSSQTLKFAVMAVIWSLLAGLSLAWNLKQVDEAILATATAAARATIDKDVAFRKWGASHGGVYVPVTERTPPNPYLRVPGKVVVTTAGLKLTLMNPAYMLRQLQQDFPGESGARSRITSLKPVNPNNAPDAWEAKALHGFEQVLKERVAVQQIDGKPYVRLLRPFVVAEECLKCHEQQGYSVGDLRGGIGIKLPLEPFAVVEQAHKVLLIGSHGGIWLFGLLGMGFWFRRERKRDIELRQASAQLQHQAHHDPLTGLPNRLLLADRMAVALAQAARSGGKLAVCYLDLDGFKGVNDSHGHAIGDRLLGVVAERLVDAVRGGDTVARLGGDEFTLLLANLADMVECEAALARLLQAVARPVVIDTADLMITASIGVTLFPDDGADADTLLRHADQALYAAKEAGRNRYHVFDPRYDHAMRERRAFLDRLEAALAQGEFCLYYQPKVDMRAGTVIGVEALIRWRHPERGLVEPADFLPSMAGVDLETQLGEWVIDQALTQMAAWRAAGLDLPVAVNIAPPHLARIDFAERLKWLLARHPDTPTNRLELEVLESAALDDIEHVSRLIDACRRLGVTVALDDFGTGYSSLTYLKRLPADLIKIDRSFVHDMLSDADDLAIIEGVIGLAEAFHISVIAEGVETAEQGVALIHLGCSLGQGYGIARPMPGEDLPGWVATYRPVPSWRQAPATWSRDDAVLLGAEMDHRIWVENLQACLDSVAAEKIEPPPMDPRLCRFGRWYHGPGRLHYGSLDEFQVIDPLHRQIHALGEEIGGLCYSGRNGEARARMAELTALRDQLIGRLHNLAKTIQT